MWKEFRDFAMRGNIVDLAMGIIIGGAFGRVVTSLVNDIVMPPLGLILGRVDFTNLYINLTGKHFDTLANARAAGVVTVNYGLFLNNVVDFLIVAFSMFLVVRQINRLEMWTVRSHPAPEQTTRQCPYCLTTIPLKATRCPACTAEVPPDAIAEPEAPPQAG